MIIAITLFGYAALMATVGAWLLREATWPTQAPRLAIAAWQTLAFSVVLSVLFGASALSMRLHLVSTDLATLFHLCVTQLRSAYATPGGAVTTTFALVLVALVSARAAWGITSTLRQAASQRRRQLAILNLVASRDAELDVLIVEHPAPAAFCLPGRNRNIIMTSTALAVLSRDELAAVIAHERAHLRGRHHLIVAVSQGLARAYPRIPVFAWGHEQVRRLVELAADDQACRQHRQTSVASAILLLADGHAPAATLALGGHATQLRLERLTTDSTPLRRRVLGSACLLLGAMLVAPAVIVLLPAMVAAGMDYCGLT